MSTPRGTQDELSVVKERTAPPADDRRKTDDIREVPKVAWGYVLTRTVREFIRDRCTVLAASLTFYLVIGIFPAILALMSIVGLMGQTETVTSLVRDIAGQLGDSSTAQTLTQTIEQLGEAPGAGIAFVVGILGALWSASGYVNAFSHAMNTVYEVDEGRSFWRKRPIMLLWTVVLLVLVLLIVVILALSGPVAEAVGGAIGLGDVALTVWSIGRWPVAVGIVVLMIAVLFHGTPNVKMPKFKWMSLGATMALVAMVVASAGFFFYVANFSSYEQTYGSVAGIIISLLWLWIINLALLFGAQFDAETERVRQLQGGIEAEETIQLPPRSVKASRKRLTQIERDVQKGRELRERHSPAPYAPTPVATAAPAPVEVPATTPTSPAQPTAPSHGGAPGTAE